jgi:Flp pilus assembly protein TadG
MNCMSRPRLRDENGQMLPMAALMICAVIAMLAFSIDLGAGFVEKANGQRAADAGSLAGAYFLPGDLTGAETEARAFAVQNGLSNDEITVQISTTLVPNDTIRVSVERRLAQRFARVAGIDFVTIRATAVARIASPSGMKQFIPFAVLDSALTPLRHGDSINLVYNSSDPTLGNSLAIAFPGTSGAADFRSAIVNGSSTPFCTVGHEHEGCPSILQSEPGNMAGPLRQGFNDLINATTTACDTFDEVFQPDPNDPSKVQILPRCNPFPPHSVTDSKRVVILPVTNALCSGKCAVPVVRFSLFFVTGIQCNSGTCEVHGRYAENVSGADGWKAGPYDPSSAFNRVTLVE